MLGKGSKKGVAIAPLIAGLWRDCGAAGRRKNGQTLHNEYISMLIRAQHALIVAAARPAMPLALRLYPLNASSV